MGKIHILDENLINQIAAGEVVERPLSVVKELVENAIDAGASNIRIELENGGVDSIIITDNGHGIASDDLTLVTQKYTTSKIASLNDLQNILSFGFRGEALASIASVSDFSLASKHIDDENGYLLQDEKISVTAMEQGTRVSVEKLFQKTPARLNYLKKPRTEYAKIYDYITTISLVYPKVGFEVIHEQKQTLFFPKNQESIVRISKALSPDFAENTITLSGGVEGLKIHGYISDPKIHFKNKKKQFLYVNNRPISSPIIFKAIYDAYNRFIPHGSFPGYIINLEIDPTLVDVNVHPRKLEVRFAEEQQIFRLVYHSIQDTLQNTSLIHTETKSPAEVPKTPQYHTGSGTKFRSYSPYTNTAINPAQGQIKEALNFSKSLLDNGTDTSPNTPRDLHYTSMGRIIGQAFNSYIIVETKTGIQILDQHALAERVIYEKIISTAYTPKTQGLLLAESFSLSVSEYENLNQNAETLRGFGFDFELLGNNTLQITGIPDYVEKTNLREIVEGVISDIETHVDSSKTLEEVKNKIAAYTACRSAVKFGDSLNLFEMHTLLNDAVIEYSATCPHGRPVISELSLDELKKLYDR